MKLLAIETTSAQASAAVLDGSLASLSLKVNEQKRNHLQTLFPTIEAALQEKGLTIKDIETIAVSEGPGSFTGIRIGISAARALCQALQIPGISVPSLLAFAFQLADFRGLVCPILDARRDQAYSAAYRFAKSEENMLGYEIEECLPEKAYDMNTLCLQLSKLQTPGETILFIGDGIKPFRPILEQKLSGIVFDENAVQNAASVAKIGAVLLEQGLDKPYTGLKPVYLRKAEAERKRLTSQVTIALMEAADIAEMAKLDQLCFSVPWTKEAFLSEQKNRIAKYYIAKNASGKLIGYAGVWHILDEGHITNVAVHPDYRRCGVGKQLIAALTEAAKEEGIKTFTLEVRPSNLAAIQLYQKYGFQEQGRRKGYYEDNQEDALILWKSAEA